MSHAGWGDVWTLAIGIVAGQPVHLQIAIGLGAAFAAVMCLEGIQASFLPRCYAARLARKYHIDRLPPPTVASAHAAVETVDRPAYEMRSARPVAIPRPRAAQRNRKRNAASISRHQPTKPKIQRISMVNAAAGFAPQALSSLSPPADPALEV